MRTIVIGAAILGLIGLISDSPVSGERVGQRSSEAEIQLAQAKPRFTLRESASNRMSDPDYDNIVGRGSNGPRVGEMAPDFELMPLKFYEFGLSDEDITLENASELYKPVRLSDFKGKKPVVLIFGSYT